MVDRPEKITAKQRRRGFEIADAIARLTVDPPDEFTHRILYRTANSLRQHFGFTDDEKAEWVHKCVTLGASTVPDLARETGFTRQDVEQILKNLEKHRLIYSQKMSYSGNGRPASLYFPVEMSEIS